MEFIRARSDEQKNQRISQIVTAAMELYETTPMDKITLAAIAQRLDFTRANLYKYVSSKEEIYLHAVSGELDAFVQEVLQHFSGLSGLSIQDFAQQWSHILSGHQRLLRLFSVLFTLLEKNVSVAALAVFKKHMYDSINKMEPVFAKLLPWMSGPEILSFLYMQLHYAVGLYPSTELSDIQQEAMRLCGLPAHTSSFEAAFAQFAAVALEGMRSQQG